MILNRYRWYKLNFKLQFRDVVDRIKESPYSDGNAIGFNLVELTKSRLSAKYIEQQLIVEELLHPFGEIEEVTRVNYIIFKFDLIYLHDGLMIMKMIDPPNSLKGFLGKLNEIFNSDFSISKMTFKIDLFYDNIKANNSIDRYTVSKLFINSIPFSNNTIAKIQLLSKGNAYEEVREKYKRKNYELGKIKIDARINGVTEFIEVSSAGTILYSNGLNNIVETYVREMVSS